MNHDLTRLVQICDADEFLRGSLDYADRTRIERHLFQTAKVICRHLVGHNLKSLSLASREELEKRCEETGLRNDLKRLVLAPFELKIILGTLASGDPYLTSDVAGIEMPGRSGAKQAFRIRVSRFAKEVRLVLARNPNPVRNNPGR